MKSSISSSFKLKRQDDVGAIATEISLIDGMPSTIEVTQTTNGSQLQKVTLTLPESKVFRYALSEFYNFSTVVRDSFKNDDDDDDDDRHIAKASIFGRR